jgi:glycosyltransferase involved in cell wall biosynthesis
LRVVFLTHYYPPEPGAPQARISALAAGLADSGVEITVHTGFPNYPDGAIRAPYRNRPWAIESDGAVRVLRSAVYPTPNRGFARRLANHACFALSALATSRRAGDADAVVVETPPMFLAGAGIAYAKLKRAPLVLHVSDLWPDSAIALGALRRPRAIGAARAIERRAYEAAAAVVVPTAGIESDLRSRLGDKVHRIPPSVDLERFEELPPPATDADRPLRVLYAGTVGLSQGLGTLVDAVALLPDPSRVELVIAGDGAEAAALRERLARGGHANVAMIGTVAHERIPELYAEADVAAVLLRDHPLFEGALPTKLLEGMSAGRPVLLSAAGEAAKLIAEAGAGIVVPPERPEALAAALTELADDRERGRRLGAAGRAAAGRFGRGSAIASWKDLLEGL